MIAQPAVEPTVVTPKGKSKEPTSNVRKNHTCSLAFCFIGLRHAYVIAWNTLACVVFGGTLVTFIGFCVGASKNTAAYVSVDIVVFIVFLHRLDHPFRLCHRTSSRCGGAVEVEVRMRIDMGVRVCRGGIRWGDLKIPERINQAQVGLRRDLGMVRDFAMSIECSFFFLCFFGLVLIDSNFLLYSELRELQQIYQALVGHY
jgi:hypothetical protein